MFAVFGRVSAGTPVKPRSANARTISASFDVPAGHRRTSTANRVCRGGVCDAYEIVGTVACMFVVFGRASAGTPAKRNGANSRTISASFDVPAGHRRTSTANLVCRGGVCDADAKVGTAARMFAVFGRQYKKPRQPGRATHGGLGAYRCYYRGTPADAEKNGDMACVTVRLRSVAEVAESFD
ncbi:hypothetical protein MRX96_058786 [Rhipicephalus microplus]